VDTETTSHIFIEPDQKGVWSVFWRIVYASALSRSHRGITDTAKIVSVEKVSDKLAKSEWALIFKNKLGTVMKRVPYFEDEY
jgi:hypothetical protein